MCQQGANEIAAYQRIWGMSEISEYEYDVLRHLNGDDVPDLIWGAGMAAAIEWLQSRGYVQRVWRDGGVDYVVTEDGIAAIKSYKKDK